MTSADHQHLAAQKVIQGELKDAQALIEGLKRTILGGFNDQLKGKNLPAIGGPSPR